MKKIKDIKQSVRRLRVKSGDEVHRRIVAKLQQAMDKSKENTSGQRKINWRTIMNKPITKYSTAAAIIIAVIGISLLPNLITPAYALEQTIEAGKNVRYLHFYFFSPGNYMPDKEAWLEYDENGELKNCRVNWHNQPTGDLALVWKEGKSQYWTKNRNTLRLFEDDLFTKKIRGFAKRYDPRRTVENMNDLAKKGDVIIDIQEPADKTKPIVLTCTWLPDTYLIEKPHPQMQEVVYVDPESKLVTSIEVFEYSEGKYQKRGKWQYPDYDTLFEPGTFDLEGEVPEDIRRIYGIDTPDIK